MSRLDELIKELCPDGVEYREISTAVNIVGGKDYKNLNEGEIPVYGSGGVMCYVDKAAYDKPSVLLPRKGSISNVFYVTEPFWNVDTIFYTEIDLEQLIPRYFYHVMLNAHIEDYNTSNAARPALTRTVLNKIKIPIPPLPVQEEIVKILDKFTDYVTELQAELQARKQQYEYYFTKIFNKFESPLVRLETIGSVKMCKRILKSQTSSEGEIPFFKIGTFGKDADSYISEELYNEYKEKYSHPSKGDVLISCSGTIGRTVVYDGTPAYFQDSNIVWLEHDGSKVTNEYLKYAYSTHPWKISTGGTISRLYNDGILKAEIPLPTIEEQNQIVELLKRFDSLCNDISTGLPAEIEARQKQYEYYRDKLLTFKEKEA